MKASLVSLCSVLSVVLASSVAAAQDLVPPPPLDQPQPQPQQPQPQQPPPQQQPIAPPPPIDPPPPPPPQSTTQRLDDSKKEDSGRGLEFLYVNAQFGAAFDALGTFSNTLLPSATSTTVMPTFTELKSGGLMVGGEAGVRLLYITLGARFRYEMLSAFNVWQLNAVVGFHIPAGKWDPYISVHGGYSAIGSIDPNNFSASQVVPGTTTQDAANAFSSKGANVGLSIGVDYYFAPFLSVGVDGAFEAIFLHRDPAPVTPPADCTSPAGMAAGCPAAYQAALTSNPLYQNSGDAAGLGFLASVHLALHL